MMWLLELLKKRNNKSSKKSSKRKYNIQRIDTEEKKVTPPEEVYERIKKEKYIN